MGGKRAMTGTGLVALALFCAMLLPAGAAAISGPEIVQRLSQQREANGIPGGLVEQPDWSAGCAKHNYYGAQTGELRHSEDPSSPFYSAEGNWAAENSVLASGSSWSQGNPWEEAPIHLIQMLAPQLSEMGAAENDNHNCATTWPGYQRPEPTSLTAYSYPGNGVSGVVPTERAAESPSVPGDLVGLPEGTATGRYLLAYLSGIDPSDAPDVTATATLGDRRRSGRPARGRLDRRRNRRLHAATLGLSDPGAAAEAADGLPGRRQVVDGGRSAVRAALRLHNRKQPDEGPCRSRRSTTAAVLATREPRARCDAAPPRPVAITSRPAHASSSFWRGTRAGRPSIAGPIYAQVDITTIIVR